MTKQNSGRSCGECNACCTVFSISEIDKHDTKLCKYWQGGVGCTIYSHRPYACKAFVCGWLHGLGGEELRPETCGYFIAGREISVAGRTYMTMHLWEVSDGALDRPYAQDLINANVTGGNIVVLQRRQGTKFKPTVLVSPLYYSPQEKQGIISFLS